MKWFKAATVGAVGSLVMFAIMYVGIFVTGIAPINTTPSAAFLTELGLPAQPLALIVHFGYGIVWSMVLVAVFGAATDIWKGLGLAGLLWIIMMLVYSPIIGWGVGGFGSSASELASDATLYLGNPINYLVITLALHVVYGLIIGWLNPLWIDFQETSPTPVAQESEQATAPQTG